MKADIKAEKDANRMSGPDRGISATEQAKLEVQVEAQENDRRAIIVAERSTQIQALKAKVEMYKVC
jgi:hypothetical protein